MAARIKEMSMGGMSAQAVSDALGVKYGSVAYHIRVMMARGDMPNVRVRRTRTSDPSPTVRLQSLRDRYEVRLGSIKEVILKLPEEKQEWLVRQAPKGGTVADVIRAIIIDAYEEENDA